MVSSWAGWAKREVEGTPVAIHRRRMTSARRPPALGATAGLAALAVMASCRCPSREAPPDLEVSDAATLCADPRLEDDDFCLPASMLEARLRQDDFEILDSHLAAQGTSKPQRLRLRFTRKHGAPLTIYAKWKQAPSSGDASNNSPRREIAAYELQKLLFDEDDWVVPPTVLRCLALSKHQEKLADAQPFGTTRCSLGVLAYWLRNVAELETLDDERFENDTKYRDHLSALNVFTFVVSHRDSVGLNFLIATDRERPRVFSVDNGMTFGAFAQNPLSWFSSDWMEIRLPALSRVVVDRVRRLRRGDLEQLAVVAELALVDGLLVPAPKTPTLDAHSGVRQTEERLQLGLTREEIDGLHQRIEGLLEVVDRGGVALR
jgi:hypothetical protein